MQTDMSIELTCECLTTPGELLSRLGFPFDLPRPWTIETSSLRPEVGAIRQQRQPGNPRAVRSKSSWCRDVAFWYSQSTFDSEGSLG